MTSGVDHVPTDEIRKTVTELVKFGIPQEKIAKYLKMCKNTLVKYYDFELEAGDVEINADVAKNLYSKILDGDVTSMIFWLKTRAKWKEPKQELDKPEDNRSIKEKFLDFLNDNNE